MSIYESYGLFVGNFDHSQAIRLKSSQGFSANRIEECRTHFQELCCNFFKRNGGESPLEPRFAASFGSTDDMAFAIVDDLSVVAHMASAAPELESYTVAYPFAPELFLREKYSKNFVTAKQLLGYESPSLIAPLIAVTQVKLSGLLMLGLGLHAQLSIVSLIAKRVGLTLQLLKEAPLRLHGAAPLFSIADIESTSFAILDPVSSDDLLILWSSTNYSVIATALTAIRKLTFSNLWDDTDSPFPISQHLAEDHCYERNDFTPAAFLNSFDLDAQESTAYHSDSIPVAARLDGNHICSATVTTLGMMANLWDDPDEGQPAAGFVGVRIISDVSPGHEGQVSDWISGQAEALKGFSQRMPRANTRMLRPGRHDLDHTLPEEDSDFVVVPMVEYRRYIYKLFARSSDRGAESGFQDISTYLSIPTPAYSETRADSDSDSFCRLMELIQPKLDTKNHTDVMHTIATCARQIEIAFSKVTGDTNQACLRRLGLTASARGALLRLCADFVSAIRDPLHFEAVLDLVDAFLHFNTILVDMSDFIATKPVRARRALAAGAREIITEFSEGLRLSFLTRIGRSSPKKEEPFGDVRGAITDLVNATDTAMKCSLGLLRRLNGDWGRMPARVSGLLAAHINQRATAKICHLPEHHLVVVKADTTHVFRVENLARVLHEVAHLYFDVIFTKDKHDFADQLSGFSPLAGTLDDKSISSLYVRLMELFSDGIVCRLIFENDFESFIRYYLLVLRSVVEGCSTNESAADTRLAAVEAYFRLFVIVSAAECRQGGGTVQPLTQRFTRDSFEDSFVQFLTNWTRLWPVVAMPTNDSLFQLARLHARSLYDQLPLYDQLAFERVAAICNEAQQENDYDLPSVRAEIIQSLTTGIPIPAVRPKAKVHEFGVVWQSVYVYIKRSFGRLSETSFDPIDSTFTGLAETERNELFRVSCLLTKTLWHVSTRQRARRLKDLLTSANVEVNRVLPEPTREIQSS